MNHSTPTAGANSKKGPRAPKYKILLVDDHPIVREHLGALIRQEPDLEVCGEAEDVAQALEQMARHTPDLALVDLALKGSHGLELIKDARIRYPRLLMLVLSMHDESLFAERALHAGAKGYITKQEATAKVLTAIRCVLGGGIYLSAQMEARLLHAFADERAGAAPAVAQLTDRELEVFEQLGQGRTTREIANRLHLEVKTVDTYRARIKDKLGLVNATELVLHAAQWVQNRSGG